MTAAIQQSDLKKRAPRIEGICEAAEKLGRSRQHLYEVLTGKRHSPILLARAKKLGLSPMNAQAGAHGKHANPPKRPVPSISLAAAENLSPQFVKILDALGWERLIVKFAAGHDSPIWKFPNIGEDLGSELQAATLGCFDSSHYDPGTWMHFFHIGGIEKLGAAVSLLKASIEKRGLLGITEILHGEDSKTLRFYYPPQPSEHQTVQVPGQEDSAK